MEDVKVGLKSCVKGRGPLCMGGDKHVIAKAKVV